MIRRDKSAKPIEMLINIGPRMAYYLAEIGIESEQELRKVGYLDAYLSLRALQPRIMNRMALYALYGALSNQDCMKLTTGEKQSLERELQARLSQLGMK